MHPSPPVAVPPNEPTPGRRTRVLVVDDDAPFRETVCEILAADGYDTVDVGDGQQALDALAAQAVGLVLLDLNLKFSALSGLGVLRAVADRHPRVPVVMISGEGTIRAAVEAIQLGAYDFLDKFVPRERLLLTVRNTLDKARLERRNERLRDEASEPYRMIGESAAMQTVREQVARAAKTSLPVLITGERGVGKELVAHNIHLQSSRAEGLFVALDVAAIPEGLVESELFGHEKAAFNDAVKRIGKFELANGGTLFLDEIADMTLSTQAKVLRALQEGEITRVGGNEVIAVDVRVVAATNKDLLAEIEAKQFRADLYDRLDVLRLRVPPLRERSEDIPALIEHLVARYWTEKGQPLKRFSAEALAAMAGYDWPGNIRTLLNGVLRLMANVDEDTIQPHHVEQHVPRAPTKSSPRPQPNAPPSAPLIPLSDAKASFERRYLIQALIAHEGNQTAAAAALSIDRSNLWRKMKRHSIEALDLRGGDDMIA